MIHQINSLRNSATSDNYEIISTEDFNWQISDGDYEGAAVEKETDFLTVKERTKKIAFITATVLSGLLVLAVVRLLISV